MPVIDNTVQGHLVFCRKHNYWFRHGTKCPACMGLD